MRGESSRLRARSRKLVDGDPGAGSSSLTADPVAVAVDLVRVAASDPDRSLSHPLDLVAAEVAPDRQAGAVAGRAAASPGPAGERGEPLALSVEGGVRIEPGAACTPHTPFGSPRVPCRGEELIRMAASVAVVEPHARGAAPDELEVDVRSALANVAKEASVRVDVVERRITLEDDSRSAREDPAQDSSRLGAVALTAALGRVDLDETDRPPVPRSTVSPSINCATRIPRCGLEELRRLEER
jgi:hypothetical protein